MTKPRSRKTSPEPIGQATVPEEVKLALHVILNHVEPGWENCKALLNHWLDSITETK